MSRIAALCLMLAVTQSPSPSGDRPLDAERLQGFALRVPVDAKVLEYAVARLTAAAHAPFGLELAPEPPLPPRVSRRPPDGVVAMNFDGLTLEMGMERLMRQVPAYSWRETSGVINVFPTRSAAPLSFLEERVPDFVAAGVTARQAIEALHRVFDPAYPSGAPTLGGGLSLLTGADESPQEVYARRESLDRRLVQVHIKNGTVRDVLNQIVASHSLAAWVVDYIGTAPAYSAARISLILGHGQSGTSWQIPFPARSRMRRP